MYEGTGTHQVESFSCGVQLLVTTAGEDAEDFARDAAVSKEP